ncbi:transport permease protein [Kineosporia sp. NBRC 101677]|uniref:ABC transporter permease n=1 Tax=Kineosporia sp. NBRC 101677 TaxID=3032197 RepID=UPI0024A034A7|nr:ABC transporter permease [Kineosporia sp. NBRC 101677]GLY16417.1 transport permease protein [Kineosporia sp. NBRC 101677]
MLSIARAELIQIFRNRLVLVTSLIMPAAVSALFIRQHETWAEMASLGYIAALVTFTVGAFGLYTTIVTTLASRRQNLFLKRLRSTAESDTGIIAGLVAPVALLSLIQVAVILVVLGAVTRAPGNVPLLALTVLSMIAMLIALALATAGLTNSPEHAQVTTLPVSLGVIGVASWVGISGMEELAAVKRLLPGGSATELLVQAWNGGIGLGESVALMVPTLAWVGLSVALATRMFRWEPRR